VLLLSLLLPLPRRRDFLPQTSAGQRTVGHGASHIRQGVLGEFAVRAASSTSPRMQERPVRPCPRRGSGRRRRSSNFAVSAPAHASPVTASPTDRRHVPTCAHTVKSAGGNRREPARRSPGRTLARASAGPAKYPDQRLVFHPTAAASVCAGEWGLGPFGGGSRTTLVRGCLARSLSLSLSRAPVCAHVR
jgi:hypothetical protein